MSHDGVLKVGATEEIVGSLANTARDPILEARVQAIRQLASDLCDRVAVMDRLFNVLYVNGGPSGRADQVSGSPEKCYESFAGRADPCQTCPAIKVFDSPDVPSVSCPADQPLPSCGMRRAFPLTDSTGEVASMLVVFQEHLGTRDSEPATSDASCSEESDVHGGPLIGRSAPMKQLLKMLRLVAASQATVLIYGESGTGKELVARSIHRLSDRREKPFVVVDCGSLPETLLESELFGHVKGSFTGASAHKRGLFEEADGGTIFLDEIADTTGTFQAKLLRTLQEGEIKRVGDNHVIKVDVRVLSATNKDLFDLVKARTFRQDLYYRLAVLPIQVPPLRDRRDDIPLLVEAFIAAACARHRQPTRRVSDHVMEVLSKADWPGNVRELQHYIERAVATTSGPWLLCDDMISTRSTSESLDLRSVGRSAAKQAERARIVQALGEASGNRMKAARLLKISRASLYLKLREYQIQLLR